MTGGAVTKIADFVDRMRNNPSDPLYDSLHDNLIVRLLQVIPSQRGTKNSVNNIKIKSISNEIYDQNNIIYAFRQLKEVLGENSEIYKGIINVAVVQSGLSPSTISYTSLIPFEDFAKIYNETLSRIEKVDLSGFNSLGVFYRNNWNNDDIVTRLSAFWVNIRGMFGPKKVYNISMEFLPNVVKNAVAKGEIPHVITLPKANRESHQEYVFYTWNQMDELLTEKDWQDIENGKVKKNTRIFAIQEKMRKEGDFSYMKKALFKRVWGEDGEPATRTYNKKEYVIYKAVNAWGEGSKANEFYSKEQPSVIDNGLEKVPDVPDYQLIELFEKPDVKKAERRAGGYMSPAADYETYSKEAPIVKMVESVEKGKEQTITLKEGTFKHSEVSSKMLEEMGYSPKRIGEILKKICG